MVERPTISFMRMKLCENIATKLSHWQSDSDRELLESQFEEEMRLLFEDGVRYRRMEHFWIGYQRSRRGFQDEYVLLPYSHELYDEHLRATRQGKYAVEERSE